MSSPVTPATPVRIPIRYLFGMVGMLAVAVWSAAAYINAKQAAQSDRDREQDARIAAVESWRQTTQGSLEKIDGRLDKLTEKLGTVAEVVGRIDERTKR